MSSSSPTPSPDQFIALIPARGGSKGIYLKNLQEVGGVSLLALAIRRALACPQISQVIVSTDDEDLARCAVEEGAEVPELRPSELAQDTTPMAEVVEYCWNRYCTQSDQDIRALVLLQPSSPFLRPESISAGIERFCQGNEIYLKAVRRVKEHPDWMLKVVDDGLKPYKESTSIRRQDLEPLYIPCGALYIYGKEYIENPVSEALAAWIEISWPEALDIDDHDDLIVAQCLAAFDGHPALLRQNQQDQPTPVEEVPAG